MDNFLIYILESTVCISVFYLLFRLLMRKETSFAVSRATLLTIVAASMIVPLVKLPQQLQTPVHVELIPEFSGNKIQIQNLPVTADVPSVEVQPSVLESTPAASELTIPLKTVLQNFYLVGVLVVLLIFIRNVFQIVLLSRKATVQQMDGYRLLIIDHEVPSFAFGRSVIISRSDYDAHASAILAHEQAHIRLNHFFDLMLLELIKTIHWFNPVVYALIGDLKEIHEFQADEQTLNKGIDATQYQKLIIQKGVGSLRFALANSFNHCQIKKRITMMNKSKNSKAWRWKVATFLPLLALLLVFCGRKSGNEPPTNSVQFCDQSFNIDRCEITNESVANISKFEVELIGSDPNEGSHADNKTITRDVIWFSLRSTNNSELAEGEYKYSSKLPQQRNLMTFTGIIHTTKKEVKISAGKIVIKKNGEKINISYHLKGDTTKIKSEITGSYFGSFSFTDRCTHPAPHPKPTKAQTIKKWDDVKDNSPTLVIEVRRDGNYVDNTSCSLYDLVKKMEALKRSNSNNRCNVHIEQEKGNGLTYNRFIEIYEVLGIPAPLQRAGLKMVPNEPITHSK